MDGQGGRLRPREVEEAGVAEEQAQPVVALDDVALVEDDDRLGAGVLGVLRLQAEGAGAALDQRDVGVAAEIERGEVRGLTPAGRGPWRGEVDVDRDHGAIDGAGAAPEHDVRLVIRLRRRELAENHREVELEVDGVEGHLVAGLPEQSGHVLDAVRVSRGAGGAGARVDRVVAVLGDLLERRLVLAHSLDRHAVQELGVRVVDPVLAGRRRRRTDCGGGQHQGHHQAPGAHGDGARRRPP